MKKRLVQTITQSGNTYGQVSDPNDLMKSQDFLHERFAGGLFDFLNNVRETEIFGFTYALGAGTAFNITVQKPGRIYTKAGDMFELLADTTLTFAAAHATLPRLDLVVGVLDSAIPADTSLIPFVRLRTADEFAASVPPYPPSNISAARELHWRVVPIIKTGTAGPTPSPYGSLASNEIPLYLVSIAPGATALKDGDVLDLREAMLTLRKINELAAVLRIDVTELILRVTKLERVIDQPIDLSQVFGEIKTLGAILAELQRQIIATRDVPEIRYDRPKTSLTDPASSKIVGVGGTAASVPYVDIPVGARVNFGDAEVAITPQGFADQTVNPRYLKVGSETTNVKRVVNIDLAACSVISADGTVDFVQKAAQFATPRSRAATAAKNNNLIQIFGGLASNNNSKLSDWYEYDIANDTLAQKTSAHITALPASDRPAMFPYGNGSHVLLCTASEDISNPKWWKVNTTTLVCTEITTTKPTGVWFFGDLIQAGKIFIVAVRLVAGDYVSDFWEFDTATDLFTQLSVTGSVPDPRIDCGHGCYYENGKFLMVTFDAALNGSGLTYVFDRASLQWTQLNITQPYGRLPTQQFPITRFRLANINGRPLLVGGDLARDTDPAQAKVWELKRRGGADPAYAGALEWVSWNATFPTLRDQGFCSALGASNLPDGKAFIFGGLGRYSNAQPKIYASSQGGLIATTHGGAAAVTIAPSSSYVTFELAPFTAAWAVSAYLGALSGAFIESGSIKVEVSFNNGTNWHVIESGGRTFQVNDSSTPGVRRMRITLYQNLSRSTVLTKLDEVLDADGTILEDRLVVRYDTPTSGAAKALYIDRLGVVTLSTTIESSTPSKALILKSTPNGTSAPAVKNYINRRRAHLKYTGIKSASGSSTQFENELAVPVRYADARVKRASDTNLYGIAAPTVAFDTLISVVGVVTNGDEWIVEIEG